MELTREEENTLVQIKTVGDVVMLAGPFGSATGKPHALYDSILAACRLLSVLRSGPSGRTTLVSAGLHVGPVVAAVLGTARLGFDVFGDSVNTASRAMTSARTAAEGDAPTEPARPQKGTVSATSAVVAAVASAAPASQQWRAGQCVALGGEGAVTVTLSGPLRCAAKGKSDMIVHELTIDPQPEAWVTGEEKGKSTEADTPGELSA